MSLASKALSIFQRDVFLFATNLATGVVVARALGPTALGLWVILQLIPAYAEALGRLKFDLAAVYVLGKSAYRREDVLFAINLMALASSAVIVGLISWQLDWLAGELFGAGASEIEQPLLLLLLQVPLQFFYLNYAYIHIAAEDVVVYNRMVLIRALGNTILALGLLWVAQIGLWAVVVAMVASTGGALMYGWLKLDRSQFQRARLNPPLVRELARYGFHLYTIGVLSQFDVYGARTITALFLAPAQVAFYGLAQGAGQILDRMPQALGTILLPRISRSDEQHSIVIVANAFRVTLLFMSAGALGAGLFAELIVTLLYGAAFAPAAGALRVMLPGFVVAGAASTLVQYFQGSGRAALIPRIQLGPLAIQLAAAFAFVQWWGLMGAALALCIGMVLRGVLEIAVFLRVAQVRPRDLLPSLADVRQIIDVLRSALARVLAGSERGKSVG